MRKRIVKLKNRKRAEKRAHKLFLEQARDKRREERKKTENKAL